MSQYRAEAAGNEELMGWSRECTVGSAIYNATAAGAKGKKLSKKELYPVPEITKKPEKQKEVPSSVKELNWGTMLGGLGG